MAKMKLSLLLIGWGILEVDWISCGLCKAKWVWVCLQSSIENSAFVFCLQLCEVVSNLEIYPNYFRR